MHRNRRIVNWVGALAGAFLALMLNVAVAHGSDSSPVTEEFHQTYSLSANGRIELANINGAVHIKAWDQNQVKVDAVKRADDAAGLKRMEIRVDARADSIAIETRYKQDDDNWNRHGEHFSEVEYTLTVPRNARLDEIKLINGELDVAGATGEVRASCINGKLSANGLAGDAKLSTINGPLEASFGAVKATRIELNSVNGPVHLTLPSDAKAEIEATTVHGEIGNDFGLHINNHRFVGHDLRGELGGGGVEIRLSNVNGTIDVHHANDGRALSPAKDAESRDDGGNI